MNILRRMSVVGAANVRSPRASVDLGDKDSQLVKKAINCITSVGLGCDLFIRPSAASELKPFKKKIELGQIPDFVSPFIAADVLSYHFHKSHESLLTTTAYPRFIRAIQIPSNNQKISEMRDVLKSLPRKNREISVMFFGILNKLAQNPFNSVNAQNLAEKLAPVLMKYTAKASKTDKEVSTDVIRFLITNHDEIFKGMMEEESNDEETVLKRIRTLETVQSEITPRHSNLKPSLTDYFTRAPRKDGPGLPITSENISRTQFGSAPSLPIGAPAQGDSNTVQQPQDAMKALMESFMDDDYDVPLEYRDESSGEEVDEPNPSYNQAMPHKESPSRQGEVRFSDDEISSNSESMGSENQEANMAYVPSFMASNSNFTGAKEFEEESLSRNSSLSKLRITPQSNTNLREYLMDEDLEYEERRQGLDSKDITPRNVSYNHMEDISDNDRGRDSDGLTDDDVLPILQNSPSIKGSPALMPEVEINPDMIQQMQSFKFGGDSESEESDAESGAMSSASSVSSMEEVDIGEGNRDAEIAYQRRPLSEIALTRDAMGLGEEEQRLYHHEKKPSLFKPEIAEDVQASLLLKMKSRIDELVRENELLASKSVENVREVVEQNVSLKKSVRGHNVVLRKLDIVSRERDKANQKVKELEKKLEEANARVELLEEERAVDVAGKSEEMEKMKDFLVKLVNSPVFERSKKKKAAKKLHERANLLMSGSESGGSPRFFTPQRTR